MRVNQAGHETDHSTQSSTKLKNKWGCASASPYDFMAYAGTTLFFAFICEGVFKMQTLFLDVQMYFSFLSPLIQRHPLPRARM